MTTALPKTPPPTWGPWVLRDDPRLGLVLDLDISSVYPGGRAGTYEVRLRECTSGAAVLDWLAHTARTIPGRPEVLGALLYALDDVLKLIENYCGDGKNRKVGDVPGLIAQRWQPARSGPDHGGGAEASS
jgi:hypothetical protein